jgi:hypothetical protein
VKLARLGYGGGDPRRVLSMSADTVLDILEFEGYRVDYERTFIEINPRGEP